MLFNLKLLGTQNELMDDASLDTQIKEFGEKNADNLNLLAIDIENAILDHYIGRQKLLPKTKVDQGIANIIRDLDLMEINPPLVSGKIESKTGSFHLGIFIKGVTAMPLVNIIVHENGKDSKTNEIIVAPRVFGWAYNQFQFLQKDPQQKKPYLYGDELRPQINQFLVQTKAVIPSMEQYLKELKVALDAMFVTFGIEG
jgi:hypothetical protein